MFNRRAFFTAVIGGAAAAAALAQTQGAEAATLIDQVLAPAATPAEATTPVSGEPLEMRGRRRVRHHRRVAHRRHRRVIRRAHRAARRTAS
jgi:zona occludens toxin (predicted ATPase)